VWLKVVDGYAIYQGDIILGRAEDVLSKAQAPQSKTNQKQGLVTTAVDLWPQGVIPYTIDESVGNPQNFLDAIQHWNEKTIIKFVSRKDETNYVTFRASSDNSICSAAAGMKGGQQFVLGSELCPTGALIHELGHTVGLMHEMARTDRDYYVRILYENIMKAGVDQYFNYDVNDIGDFDYGSIMIYAAADFSKNGGLTMETVPAGIPIGQIDALSAGDIDAVAHLYGSPKGVTVATNPPGLTVVVDGEVVVTPRTFEWVEGSKHTIEAPESQTDDAGRYDFGRWSDDGERTHTVEVSPDRTLYTANLVRYVKLSIGVFPKDAGTVTVTPGSEDGYYRENTRVRIQATPAEGYYFAEWSSPFYVRTKRSHVSANPIGTYIDDRRLNFSAIFSKTPPVLFTDNTGSGTVVVDGTRYFMPAGFVWENGTAHTVSVDESFPDDGGTSVRTFDGWSNGGNREQTVTATREPATYTANFKTKYALDFGVYPSGSGTLRFDPESADGYYDAGTTVTITGAPRATYAFSNYLYDVTGPNATQTLTMNEYSLALGVFARPNNIGLAVNAATKQFGFMQLGYIAPGEILDIYVPGAGSDETAVATPDSSGKLPTTLANTRVLFGRYAAPIVSVAKNVVTTIVPYAADGLDSVNIAVQLGTRTTPAISFDVWYAEPGIFTKDGSGNGQAKILNEDGSANGPDSPAALGSVVTVYATGEGVSVPDSADGQIQPDPAPQPYNPMELRIGGTVAEIVSATGVPGQPAGLLQIKAKIPQGIRTGNAVTVMLVVDGNSPSQSTATMAVQ
jgi:astacin